MEMAIMRRGYLTCGCFTILWLLGPLLAATTCEPVSDETAIRLGKFMHDKLDFPQTITLMAFKIESVGDTCFKRVHFRPREQDTGLNIVVYVSPDNRFVTRDLLDTTVNPSEQRLHAQEDMRKRLAEGDFPSKGPATGPITIVMFSDFQCPYCKQAVDILNSALAAEQNTTARIVFRHLPLPGHSWARQAAEMAACAYKQNDQAFWHLHDFLFSKQEELTSENLSDKVISVLDGQLNVGQYLECVAARQETARIDEDIAFAAEQRIRSTPTLFINGQRREGLPEFAEIRNLVKRSGNAANN